MSYAERIYERVKEMPDEIAIEVYDFTEFLVARRMCTVTRQQQPSAFHINAGR